MSSKLSRREFLAAAGITLVGAAAAACGAAATPTPQPKPTTAAAAQPTKAPGCDDIRAQRAIDPERNVHLRQSQ